jgi:hypothetical protein
MDSPPSEPIAAAHVAPTQSEESERQDDEDEIEHGVMPPSRHRMASCVPRRSLRQIDASAAQRPIGSCELKGAGAETSANREVGRAGGSTGF